MDEDRIILNKSFKDKSVNRKDKVGKESKKVLSRERNEIN